MDADMKDEEEPEGDVILQKPVFKYIPTNAELRKIIHHNLKDNELH